MNIRWPFSSNKDNPFNVEFWSDSTRYSWRLKSAKVLYDDPATQEQIRQCEEIFSHADKIFKQCDEVFVKMDKMFDGIK